MKLKILFLFFLNISTLLFSKPFQNKLEDWHNKSRILYTIVALPSIINNHTDRPNKKIYFLWNYWCKSILKVLTEAPLRKALEKEKPIEQYFLEFLNDFPLNKINLSERDRLCATSRATYLLYEFFIEKILYSTINNNSLPSRINRKLVRFVLKTISYFLPLILIFTNLIPCNTITGNYTLNKPFNPWGVDDGDFSFNMLITVFLLFPFKVAEELLAEIGGELLISSAYA